MHCQVARVQPAGLILESPFTSAVEMGQRAWRLARTDLSWETTCARLAELYAELATSRKRQGRPA